MSEHSDSDDVHGAHQHEPDMMHGVPRATMRSYLVGFVLSVILTAIPFWLVMRGVLGSTQATVIALMFFAFCQILVHMVCFLHMTPKVEGGWSLTALGFTVTLVVIVLTGSVWVMYHLSTNMMSGVDTSQVP